MKKNIYRTPSIRIVDLKIEGILQTISGGGDNPNFTTEAKRQTRIIIDDEEEDEWEDY